MTGPDFPQPHSKQVRGVVTGDTRRKEGMLPTGNQFRRTARGTCAGTSLVTVS